MPKRRFTISAFADNSPGVLLRITTLFTRRGLNIESLTVCDTETNGISRFTIVIYCTRDLAEKVSKQINRVVEVKNVYFNENRNLIYKEIAFYKVETKDPKNRIEIEDHATRHGAEIIYAEDTFLVVEATGTEDEIKSLFRLLEPFGIKEFVRSGRIAVRKEKRFVEIEGN